MPGRFTSYEELAELLEKYVPAYMIEIEKLFRLVVFNYLFFNGEHLKIFSVLETPNGGYTLSPANDLVNTRIYVGDSDFALDRGLFKDNFESEEMKKNGHAGLKDFHEFSSRLEISTKRRDKLQELFLVRQATVEILIQRSFLNEQTKRAYMLHYQIKRNKLKIF